MSKAPDTPSVWVWGPTEGPTASLPLFWGSQEVPRKEGVEGLFPQGALDPLQKGPQGVPISHPGTHPHTLCASAHMADSADVPCGLDSPTPLLISKEGVSF